MTTDLQLWPEADWVTPVDDTTRIKAAWQWDPHAKADLAQLDIDIVCRENAKAKLRDLADVAAIDAELATLYQQRDLALQATSGAVT